MNKKRILQLADHLETERVREHFDMSHFFHKPDSNLGAMPANKEDFFSCGAAACIAGWAVALFTKDNLFVYGASLSRNAEKLLKLSPLQAQNLFIPDVHTAYHNITPDQAAEVLRRFANTNRIEWKEVLGETEQEEEYEDD